jgi:Diaminopimelate epimerase
MNKDTNQIMALINAFKMDGLGNDFVIIDRKKNSIDLTKKKLLNWGVDLILGLIK